jgi:hypothetical protein
MVAGDIFSKKIKGIQVSKYFRLQRSYFTFAFVLITIGALDPYVNTVFGFDIPALLTIRPALILLTIAAYLQVKESKFRNLGNRTRAFLIFTIVYSIILLIRGVLSGNPFDFIYTDTEPSVFLLTGIILGSDIRNWEFINRLFIKIMLVGSIINVLAVLQFSSLARTDTYDSVAYNIQYLTWPVLFFIITLPYQKKQSDKIVIIFTFVVYIVEQLAFQKRLPMTLGLVSLVLYLYYSRKATSKKTGKSFNFIFAIIGLLFLGLVVVQFLSFAGLNLGTSASSFWDRLASDDQTNGTSLQNGRFYSAGVIFSSIKGIQILIGQGFGAFSTSTELWWNTVDTKTVGVSIIEVGQVWPYWKGGIIFWILINGFTFIAYLKGRKIKNNTFNSICVAFLLVMFISFFSQSFAGTQRIFILLWGLVTGYTLKKWGQTEGGI